MCPGRLTGDGASSDTNLSTFPGQLDDRPQWTVSTNPDAGMSSKVELSDEKSMEAKFQAEVQFRARMGPSWQLSYGTLSPVGCKTSEIKRNRTVPDRTQRG